MLIAIENSDLELSVYINAGGHLSIRLNKNGVCCADILIHDATKDYTPEHLMKVGALTRPVIRDLSKPDTLQE